MSERWFSKEGLAEMAFTMNPWRNRRYGPDGWGVTDEAHCTHCAFMNEALPIRWIGYPVYPSDPPEDFDRDPCVWHWYKEPADIPERDFSRHGLERGD